jgi:hypothetical protein
VVETEACSELGISPCVELPRPRYVLLDLLLNCSMLLHLLSCLLTR